MCTYITYHIAVTHLNKDMNIFFFFFISFKCFMLSHKYSISSFNGFLLQFLSSLLLLLLLSILLLSCWSYVLVQLCPSPRCPIDTLMPFPLCNWTMCALGTWICARQPLNVRWFLISWPCQRRKWKGVLNIQTEIYLTELNPLFHYYLLAILKMNLYFHVNE